MPGFSNPPPTSLSNNRMSLQSVLQKGKAFLTPKGSSDSLITSNGFIFPKVDSAIDGEDCDHDCETCEVQLPKGWKIDHTEKLYGHIHGWATHMLVATGKTDWVKDVSDEKGSVMQAVRDCKVEPENGKLMLSASNMPRPSLTSHSISAAHEPTTILLLPAFTFIDNVTPATVPELIRHHISSAPTTTTPLPTPASHEIPQPQTDYPLSTSTRFTLRPCPHKYLILMCSQRTRDARCGQSAPLLKREFERHLRPLGLYRDMQDERPGGVGIYFISHVGGHKFAANVMVYRRADALPNVEADVQSDGTNGVIKETNKVSNGTNRDAEIKAPFPKKLDINSMGEGAQCIWLARVRPEDCEGIIKYTVLQGKVVKPQSQLRGGFDRAKGLVSW
ncbi:hypothetical protein N7G274_006319 [Stereocaulon virgatum]|uniref:Sucrase/ferredoxin-like family protein n=1 Tax=Stereocaulon virgatum TaxID=373712 RepID=A0ABR4A7H6_9LECA